MDSGNIGKPRLFTHTKSAESKATDGIHQPKRTDAEVVAQTSRATAAQGSPSVGEVPIGRREAEKIYTPPALIRMNADAPMKI